MSATRIRERSEIPEQDKWNLSPMYKSEKEWEEEYGSVKSESGKYKTFEGTLHQSAEKLKECLVFDLSLSRKLEKLYTYAHLKSDEDKSNQQFLGYYQQAINLYTMISELSSFITPEIQGIPEDQIKKFMSESLLEPYKFLLERILRVKPHTRTKEIEEILALSSEISHAPSQIFSQLDNVDLSFGTMKNERGETLELSHGNFNTFLISPSGEIREKAFFQYYEAYNKLRHTISASLVSSIQKDCFYAKVRKFSDSRRAALFSDNVQDSVYDNLINVVRESVGSNLNYLSFRKDALGLKELHFYDTYVPVVPSIDFKLTYEEAVDICVEAMIPLGDEYCETLKKGLMGDWVDRYENRGKRSGAYSSGCYDSYPYILLNYEETNINSLYTLIHEAGHSMHSHYSRLKQPYHYSDYTIFVAEVASTFNETLLSDYLLKKYSNDTKMKAYIANREVDNIRATLFRQTMFAEFEKITHSVIEERKPLTLDNMTEIYKGLLYDYFRDGIVIDEVLSLECLRIPHFYSAFYVYKYATGISAALSLAEMVLSGGAAERDRYLNFLGLGGSKYPLDELVDAGVDMSVPEPVRLAISYFDSRVDLLKEVYKSL